MGVTQDLGAKKVEVRSDSQVVVWHEQGEYEAQGEKMKRYLAKVQEIQASFEKMIETRVPREDNTQAISWPASNMGPMKKLKPWTNR